MAAGDRTITAAANPQQVEFSSDGKSIVATCGDGHVRTWDVESGKLISERTRKREDGPAALLSAGRYAEIGPKNAIRVWDLTANAQAQTLYGHATRPGRVSMSNDGKLIASASEKERSVRLWNSATGEQKHLLSDGIGGVAQLAFSPDGETLVSTNYDNDIRVWKTRSGELVRKVEDMTGAMFAAEFTPDGKQLIVAGLDQTVYVYDAKDWSIVKRLKGHGETISALAVSPNGRLLVTGGFDVITVKNPVKVVFWDLANAKIVRTVQSPHRVVALAFAPNGQWVAMTAGEKEISLWKAPAA